MIDCIVQEVREARAEIAAEFGHDRAKFWAWARAQQEAEREAKHELPVGPQIVETTGGAGKSAVVRKRRVGAARVSE